MRRVFFVLMLLMLADCGDGGSPPEGLPPDAVALADYTETGVKVIVPRLGGFEALLPLLLSPGAPGSEDFSFSPDPTPGAPANTFVFDVPYDGNGDGLNETTISGRATFNDAPGNAGVGFGGTVAFTMETLGGLGSFAGTMDFTLTSTGREFSGSGTFTEALTGYTTTVTIDQASPLQMKAATGAADAVANACGYSLNGNVGVVTSGDRGSLASTWGFASSRSQVAVTDAVFTSTGGQTTNLPDSNIEIPCGDGGSIQDWNGTFLQRWACLPPEYGQAQLTMTVSGTGIIQISDEDPPGSGDVQAYTAAAIPGNPHVVRGFFIGGPAGNQYREDFIWTLVPNSQRFTQISRYVYQEGANQGSGGMCGGAATRGP